MDAPPVQGVVSLIVDGGDLAPCTSHQLHYLLGGLSLLCGFSFSFSLGTGFCFCCESPAGKEGVHEVEQISETEVHSWLLVGTLVEDVGVECSAVLGVKALPKQLITFPLRHDSEEEEAIT